jgi:oxygen-independent coproporphyrinogen-3 oxidase
MDPVSLYLHIPFCHHRCGYCDFNTYAGKEALISKYIEALAREVQLVAQGAGDKLPVHTIFFGGGTPSLVPANLLASVFDALYESFEISPKAEITLEANPGTVDEGYLSALRGLGVNRLSMGVQSANPKELEILERQHGYQDAIQAVKDARAAGFDNLSVDLIFGLPHQVLADWQANLEKAMELDPDHISLYALTIEHGTPLESQVKKGVLPEPDPDIAAEMYEWTMDFLAPRGYTHYEISNWAKKDERGEVMLSCHNQQYWLNQPYLGFGAGAHGFIAGHRTANVLGPEAYIKRCISGEVRDFPRSPATVNIKQIDRFVEMQETMMMGLRLLEMGVSHQRFEARFGEKMEEIFTKEIAQAVENGLLVWDGDTLKLTRKGRLLGNQVFVKFV